MNEQMEYLKGIKASSRIECQHCRSVVNISYLTDKVKKEYGYLIDIDDSNEKAVEYAQKYYTKCFTCPICSNLFDTESSDTLKFAEKTVSDKTKIFQQMTPTVVCVFGGWGNRPDK